MDRIPTNLTYTDLPTLRKLQATTRLVADRGMPEVEDAMTRSMLESMLCYTADFIDMLLSGLEVCELEELFDL